MANKTKVEIKQNRHLFEIQSPYFVRKFKHLGVVYKMLPFYVIFLGGQEVFVYQENMLFAKINNKDLIKLGLGKHFILSLL